MNQRWTLHVENFARIKDADIERTDFSIQELGGILYEMYSNAEDRMQVASIHIFGIKLTGTSVNPARSFAPALILGGDALSQVWVFIVGPFVGAAFAALVSFFIDLQPENKEVVEVFDIEKVEAEEKRNSKKNEVIIEKVVKAEEKPKAEKNTKNEKTTKDAGKKPNKTSKTTKPATLLLP